MRQVKIENGTVTEILVSNSPEPGYWPSETLRAGDRIPRADMEALARDRLQALADIHHPSEAVFTAVSTVIGKVKDLSRFDVRVSLLGHMTERGEKW